VLDEGSESEPVFALAAARADARRWRAEESSPTFAGVMFDENVGGESKRLISVAVWYVNSAVPELQELVSKMHEVQAQMSGLGCAADSNRVRIRELPKHAPTTLSRFELVVRFFL